MPFITIKLTQGGLWWGYSHGKVCSHRKIYYSKNHHTWGCPFYVLGARLKGNIDGLPKLGPHSYTGI